jgi:hypothetical protein
MDVPSTTPPKPALLMVFPQNWTAKQIADAINAQRAQDQKATPQNSGKV